MYLDAAKKQEIFEKYGNFYLLFLRFCLNGLLCWCILYYCVHKKHRHYCRCHKSSSSHFVSSHLSVKSKSVHLPLPNQILQTISFYILIYHIFFLLRTVILQ